MAVAAEPLLEAGVHRSPAAAEAEELPAHGPDHRLLEGFVREGPFRDVGKARIASIEAAPERPNSDQHEKVFHPVERHDRRAIRTRMRPVLTHEFDALMERRVDDALG